jgi:hypothetical protein
MHTQSSPHNRTARRLLIAVALLLVSVSTVTLVDATGTSAQGRLPPEKQAMLERESLELAAARKAPLPSKTLPNPAGAKPDAPRLAPLTRTLAGQGSIVETGLAPFSSAFLVENHWYESRSTGQVIVYAGARRTDLSQGILVVVVSDALNQNGSYLTPSRVGAVRVIAANGERLTLAASNGTEFTFDVTSRQFVSS